MANSAGDETHGARIENLLTLSHFKGGCGRLPNSQVTNFLPHIRLRRPCSSRLFFEVLNASATFEVGFQGLTDS